MARVRRPYAPRLSLEDRRAQVLDGAVRVLVRDGYDGLSVDAIAREIGVTRPAVYRAFDGQAALFAALLDRQEARALEQLTAAVPGDLGAAGLDAFVGATVRRLCDMVVGDPDTWRPIFLASDGAPGAIRERIAHDRELVRLRFRGLLQIALRAPSAPGGADPDVLSHALVAIGEDFARRILEDPPSLDVDRIVETIEALLTLRPRP
ncbi:MAG: TetR/AcrR family transcriptional regulator [Solirubrobacteraceae bacterium]